MKRNAITRIIIFSVLIFVLLAALIFGLVADSFHFSFSFGGNNGTYVDGKMSIASSSIENIHINWAAGSVSIQVADTNEITFSEVMPSGCKHIMTYEITGKTLELNYNKSHNIINNVSIPEKDLIITVPKDWNGGKLELNGASLDIKLENISVKTLELNGASCNLQFTGYVDAVQINGASTHSQLTCLNRVSDIEINGASCDLNLVLPKDCGFVLEMDGLSCNLHTDLPGTSADGKTRYGDGHCKISANGMSCDVTIAAAAE